MSRLRRSFATSEGRFSIVRTPTIRIERGEEYRYPRQATCEWLRLSSCCSVEIASDSGRVAGHVAHKRSAGPRTAVSAFGCGPSRFS
jgi:hypothetical protein